MTDQPKTKQVKDLLRRYTAMLRNIDNQYARLDRLAVKMEAPPGPDLTGMPRGQGTPTDRTGMMVMRKMELEEQITKAIDEERAERRAIDSMIEEIGDPDERAVLRLRYFDRAEWEDVTFALYGDRADYIDRAATYERRTFRLHGRALLVLARVDMGKHPERYEQAAEGPAEAGRDEVKRSKMAVKRSKAH